MNQGMVGTFHLLSTQHPRKHSLGSQYLVNQLAACLMTRDCYMKGHPFNCITNCARSLKEVIKATDKVSGLVAIDLLEPINT